MGETARALELSIGAVDAGDQALAAVGKIMPQLAALVRDLTTWLDPMTHSELLFDLQPRLVGTLIELRPLERADFDALFRAASDRLVWEQHPEPDRYRRAVFERYFDGAIESQGAFAVIDRRSGAIIGSSRYCNLRPAEREVEIGWTFLERAYWGGAYNGELKALMLDHAFRFVERVVFVVGEHNERSRRALRKIGATIAGDAEVTAADGTVQRNLIFAISRASWTGAGAPDER